MSEDKVKAILDWPVPRKVKDIQSFLGFANFYRHFIHEYSDIVIPLTRLTHKGTPWKFNNKCMAAFNELKQAFTHAPILTHWVPNRQLVVETDASDYAIATILSIYLEDGEIHPITFLSWSLHNAELNYDTHDKELLAIFEAFNTGITTLKALRTRLTSLQTTRILNILYYQDSYPTASLVVRIPLPVQPSNPVLARETRRETGHTH